MAINNGASNVSGEHQETSVIGSLHESEDGNRQAEEGFALWEFSHKGGDGVMYFKIIGFTQYKDVAEDWLKKGDPAGAYPVVHNPNTE